MSTRDFEHKQIAFVFTTEGEKISFKNDNLIVSDTDGKIKHQSTCYRPIYLLQAFCIVYLRRLLCYYGIVGTFAKIRLYHSVYDTILTDNGYHAVKSGR